MNAVCSLQSSNYISIFLCNLMLGCFFRFYLICSYSIIIDIKTRKGGGFNFDEFSCAMFNVLSLNHTAFLLLIYSTWTDPCNKNGDWTLVAIQFPVSQTDPLCRWSHHVTTERSLYFTVFVVFFVNRSYVILHKKLQSDWSSVICHRSVSDQSVNGHWSVKSLRGSVQGLYSYK